MLAVSGAGLGGSGRAQRLLVHLISLYISGLLLTKMIYQIDYIDHSSWDVNCTLHESHNVTKNDAEWIGLTKTDQLTYLLRGYIGT